MQEIAYKVIRSNRKSVALVVDNNANLIVRAPFQVDDAVIADFVQKKRRWIDEKQRNVAFYSEEHPIVTIATGESLMYLGDSYTIVKSEVENISVSGNEILIPEKYGLSDVVEWLKQQATSIICERVKRYAQTMGVTPREVKMSDARARWGSCSSINNLNFTWRLILCPLSAIDYVVVHELSHITYKNHSSAFWARVKTVLPHYKIEQDWLKANKKLMDII